MMSIVIEEILIEEILMLHQSYIVNKTTSVH